jgi:hypothetical protein
MRWGDLDIVGTAYSDPYEEMSSELMESIVMRRDGGSPTLANEEKLVLSEWG